MRRVVVLFVLLLVLVFGFLYFFDKSEEKSEEPKTTTVNITAEVSEAPLISEKTQKHMYAVWLTYSEIGSLVKNKTEEEYRESLQKLFDNLEEGKINTVFYQCRAFCDSFYESEIFPVSKYMGEEKLAFDPFEIFLEMAKSKNIKVHCWVNPYRVSYNNDFSLLPENSPVRKLYKDNENSLFICNEGIFLNPAVNEGRKLVLDGIREILNKYQVDGIHFDDYFYPDTDDLNDKTLYKAYQKNGGILSLADWRRENVSALVGSVYSLVKSYNEALIFSISPSADIEKCKNVFYADVEKWCSEEGFADYIIPQIYFGFENEKMPFEAVVKKWEKLTEGSNVKLICGMAAYKCGKADENAGTGKNEWQENVNILSRQYEQTLKSQAWQGFSLFSYSYTFSENMSENSKKEIKNLLYMVE